ncbi:hypothetical protein PoB_004520400 [Plakobranchus ocellatus]|uniref:Uncharacterized protein n=1 Tax=Plakobranchus ocellatus TaxID=259542 RepID=A0AAV4BIK1_9GAST|nr:hypothetical protein PoB_004520400 [Plakobranchus ocellatus]
MFLPFVSRAGQGENGHLCNLQYRAPITAKRLPVVVLTPLASAKTSGCIGLKGVSGPYSAYRGVGGTVACESALRSAGTLLSRVRAPPSAPRHVGGP